MFFILSKILGFLAAPSNVLIVFAGIGLMMLTTRRWRAGRRLAALGILGLVVAGLSPLGNILMSPLEDRFPPWTQSAEMPVGIIVLGGAIDPDLSAARHQPALNEAAERMTAVADLARRFPQARIVFSGGNGDLVGGAPEAQVARDLLVTLGVAPDRITLEATSRNTSENARFTKALINPGASDPWLLVTSAAHMPRAVGVFRREGFYIQPYPVDWRTRGREDWAVPFRWASSGLARVDAAAHEWVGLVVYYLTGRTLTLFPAP
jgi:uncharacterized SAM-binding protein YcdF (DUF218 family)